MKGRFLLFGVTLFLFCAAALPAQGQERVKLRLPLTKLAPVETTSMKGAFASYSLKLPIPERWQIEKASLHFSYVNSTALIPQNSRLVVLLNRRVLAQAALQAQSPVGEVTVSLPPRLLKPGYQDLEFNVVQHYTLECEDPTAPELWTTLEMDKSYLDFEFRLKTVPLELRAVSDFLFDSRIASENRVNLVIEDLSPERVELAGLAASAIALRFEYRPVVFSVSHALRPGMDNVLMGERKFVKEVLGEKTPETKGPALSLLHLPSGEEGAGRKRPDDPTRALIVVFGESFPQVREAALTLASLSFPYPGTPSMEVKEIRFPPVEESRGKGFLAPGEKYAFQSLGFETTTFQGMMPTPRSIDLRIPSHLLAPSNEFIWLSLHLAYGSGMRKDSVLNIFFNGKYVSSIFLENPQGGAFRGYQVPIPAYQIKRGRNVISFSPVMTPLVTGKCDYVQTENLLLTLFGDSSLKLPPMSSWVDLPRMELLFQDGFPFTRWPDGRETTVFLAEKSLSAASAGVNLLALGAQKIGYPIHGARFSFELPKDGEREILAVGPVSRIPPELLGAAPLKFGRDGAIAYPLMKSARGEGRGGEDSFVLRVLGRFISPPPAKTTAAPPPAALSRQVSGLGPQRAVLTQFQSPFRQGRSVLLLSASTSQDLEEAAALLWEPAIQARVGGDLSILELGSPEYRTVSVQMGSKYYTGERDPVSRLSLLLYTYPWLFFALVLLAFVLLALGVYHLLKKQRRKRAGHEQA